MSMIPRFHDDLTCPNALRLRGEKEASAKLMIELARFRAELDEAKKENERLRASALPDIVPEDYDAMLYRAEQAEAALAVINEGRSPCGHWSAHAMTNDGGKTIQCLECALAAANERAEEAQDVGARLMLDALSKAVESGGMFSDPRANVFVLAVKQSEAAREALRPVAPPEAKPLPLGHPFNREGCPPSCDRCHEIVDMGGMGQECRQPESAH